jgi:pre-rRNA-processing protein TSR2
MEVEGSAAGGASNMGQCSCPLLQQQLTSVAAQRQEKFDLGVWLTLSKWEALNVAVQNLWGGPDSADKRDWFAGAVSELFTDETSNTPETEDVEERLLQIMEDEFEVVVDDGSSTLVADRIMAIWQETGEGNFRTVDALHTEFQEKKNRPSNHPVKVQSASDDEDSVDEESDDDDDIEMEEAPALAPVKEKAAPEVDEHGFTKVVGKKRR